MWSSSSLTFLFLLVLAVSISLAIGQPTEEALTRSKRSYYGGYDMYGDDFWYAGRIIGIIVGICLLLFCCCLPCVCIAGIWFAGWFGLRQRNQKKNTQQVTSSPPAVVQYPQGPAPNPINYDIPGNANYIPNRQMPRQVQVDSSPRDSEISRVMVPGDQVIFSAEDRYYTSSTAPAPNHRPDAYNSSRY